MRRPVSATRLERLLQGQPWYVAKIADGVDPNLPGIYEWRIEGVGVYIGKYTRITRPLCEYRRNVDRLLKGLSYHGRDPAGFRRIHRELAVVAKNWTVERPPIVTITILENVTASGLRTREAELICERGSLNG